MKKYFHCRTALLAWLAVILLPASLGGATWVEGVVLEKDPDRSMIRIEHGELPEGPDAGPNWFQVSSLILPHIREEQEVRGRLVRSGRHWRLENLSPYQFTHQNTLRVMASQLQRDSLARGRGVERRVGERIPAFALLDQEGNLFQNSDLQNHYTVLNFVFSRCPQPDMCPAATARMVHLQAEAAEAGIAPLRLVTITLDPEYDTPFVLKAYADTHGADLANYSFLTGPQEAINELLRQFGITTREADGTIDHTMSTVLIGPQGTILHKASGRTWSVLEFLTRITDHQQKETPS